MPGLDGLRALAVAAVFAYHAEASWLPGGYLGVDVFFVLSGYLITALLVSEHQRRGSICLADFWGRRFRRLAPALVVMLGVTLLATAIVDPSRLASTRNDALSALLYVANWHDALGHASYFSQFGRPPLLRHLWSLSVEEQFYLLWPPLVMVTLRLGGRRHLICLALILAVASALEMTLLAGSASATRLYEGTDTRAETLLVGALAALLVHPQRLRGARRVPPALVDLLGVLGAAGIGVMMCRVGAQGPSLFRGPLQSAALLAVVSVMAAGQRGGVISWLLSRRPLRWLGERSYGIYLWHWPVIALTRSPDAAYGQSLWLTALQAAITVALAAASFTLIEAPIRHHGLRGALNCGQDRLRTLATREAVLSLAVANIAALAVIPGLIGLVLGPGLGRPQSAQASQPPTAIRGTLGQHRRVSSRSQRAGDGPIARGRVSGPTIIFGDSVILDTDTAFAERLGPSTMFNAQIGRQPGDTVAAVAATRAAGGLPPRVVISLGDNGLVTSAMLHSLARDLSGVADVVLVTPRVPDPWGPASAAVIEQARRWWPGMHVAQWEALSNGHDAWFSDGVHLTPEGVRAYVSLVLRTLDHR